MTFRLNSLDASRPRRRRQPATPNTMFNIVMMFGAILLGLAALDAYMTDGRNIRFLINDGVRPFRTMLDTLRVRGL